MPNLREHCKHSESLYGVDGRDLHQWIDAPVLIEGPKHRKYRHAPDIEIPKKFIDEYGSEMARNILIDHIILDKIEAGAMKKELELVQTHLMSKTELKFKKGKLIKEFESLKSIYEIAKSEFWFLRETFREIPLCYLMGSIMWIIEPKLVLSNPRIYEILAYLKYYNQEWRYLFTYEVPSRSKLKYSLIKKGEL